MNTYEVINFVNYDNLKNDKLIDNFKKQTDSFIMYNNFQLNSNLPYFVKDMNFENFITMNLNDLICDIELSFNNIKEMQTQFVIDIRRSKMTFNGQYVKDPFTIVNYLESKYRDTNNKLEKEYLMLSTQALFAIPFYIIQKSVEKKDLYLSEMTDDDCEQFKIKKKYKVDICNGSIKLEKYMRLFSLSKTSNSETKYIVKINIDIELIKDRTFILSFFFI
tara:strand:- start:619 stop:1278 length:660 start_codon:yes stop_codon:yes gene_type:complete